MTDKEKKLKKFVEFWESLADDERSLIYSIFRLQDKGCYLDFKDYEEETFDLYFDVFKTMQNNVIRTCRKCGNTCTELDFPEFECCNCRSYPIPVEGNPPKFCKHCNVF